MIDRRNLMRHAVAGGLMGALLSPARLLAAEAMSDADYLRFVHPELRHMARRILEMAAGEAPLGPDTLAAQRAAMKAWVRPPRADVPVERRAIPGAAGQPDVVVHVVNARPGESRPAILHTHGGGFVSGTAEAAVAEVQDLCATLGAVAVTVEYRLAPETTWQGSVEDNHAALKWLHAHAAELGADPARIAVMGESAGGGHAALLALAARDRGEVPVAFQCLTYPMLDDRTGSSRVVPDHIGRIIWNAQKNRFGWESFLGMAPGGAQVPAAAVPARRDDLAGLPPAFIGVGGIDLFVDEDVDYAQRLNAAGVPAELIVVPGAFHGFDGMPGPIRISQWFRDARLDALRRGLGIAIA